MLLAARNFSHKGKCLLTTTYQGKDNKYTRKWLYLTSVPLPFPQRTLDRRIDHFAQYLKDVSSDRMAKNEQGACFVAIMHRIGEFVLELLLSVRF